MTTVDVYEATGPSILATPTHAKRGGIAKQIHDQRQRVAYDLLPKSLERLQRIIEESPNDNAVVSACKQIQDLSMGKVANVKLSDEGLAQIQIEANATTLLAVLLREVGLELGEERCKQVAQACLVEVVNALNRNIAEIATPGLQQMQDAVPVQKEKPPEGG